MRVRERKKYRKTKGLVKVVEKIEKQERINGKEISVGNENCR